MYNFFIALHSCNTPSCNQELNTTTEQKILQSLNAKLSKEVADGVEVKVLWSVRRKQQAESIMIKKHNSLNLH